MAASPLFQAKAAQMRELPSAAIGSLYIAAKDAKLAKTLTDELQLDLSLFKGAAAIYDKALDMGLANEDMVAIIKVLENSTGQKIVKR